MSVLSSASEQPPVRSTHPVRDHRGGDSSGPSDQAQTHPESASSTLTLTDRRIRAYELKPTWQHDTGCANRTIADVSADADPNTGVAVYDSYASKGQKGWLVFGGTSVASPIIASVYALAGNAANVTDGSYPYSHTSNLFDVTSGSNGSCGGTYLCTGEVGYDGPTGNGTPNGPTGF